MLGLSVAPETTNVFSFAPRRSPFDHGDSTLQKTSVTCSR